MTKPAKKKNRRLKRTVRKTLGAVFMASAIAVAAIPVENLRAYSTAKDYEQGVDIENCLIPIMDEDSPIYTTGDGRFQFAYTSDIGADGRGAIILGYKKSSNLGALEGGILTIPNEVDAYKKYPLNSKTSYGYCAVSRGGDYLFYEEITDKTDEFGNLVYEDDLTKPILDDNGQPTGEYEQKVVQVRTIKPCYFEYYDTWGVLKPDQLYYQSGTDSSTGDPVYSLATAPSNQRQQATVYYIGNQRIQEGNGDAVGTWTIVPDSKGMSAESGGHIDTPEEGIFRGEICGNVETLYVGKDLMGIGDYAFNGCTNLSKIRLENGLNTLGNYAFANCVNLEFVDIDVIASLTTIGHHAFYNCSGLREFRNPRQVSVVGDSAFERCSSIIQVDLCGGGSNVQLKTLGKNVFKGCKSLESLTLPESLEQKNIDLAMFDGCSSLKSITALNSETDFNADLGAADRKEKIKAFVAAVPDEFYFEGTVPGALYNTARDHFVAFKYLNQDIYEITRVHDDGTKEVYQVNSANKLIMCQVDDGVSEVDIPRVIGPCHITTIDSSSFQGHCFLKRIVIPSSIEIIEANAFLGCHNLKTVIFEEPVNIKTIGSNAFQTQQVTAHKTACPNQTLDPDPVLQFVGPIPYDHDPVSGVTLENNSRVPFDYAMDPGSNINVGEQSKSYITYYSSWPENLQVRYRPGKEPGEPGKRELVNYITFNELKEIGTMTRGEAMAAYPYMTESNVDEYQEDVRETLRKAASGEKMSDNEQAILDAAVNIVIPEGVETIMKDLFSAKEPLDAPYGLQKKITTYGLEEIEEEAFAGCSNLKEISIWGNTKEIGDHAFLGCDKLDTVTVSPSVETLGVRPFAECRSLYHVNFQGSNSFTCDNSIIFELDSSGNKRKVVEYLEGKKPQDEKYDNMPGRRNSVVESSELKGVSEIAEEAFMGTDVSIVDLGGENGEATSVKVIPERAFADTKKLFQVNLPMSWESIGKDAFSDSSLANLEIPGAGGMIHLQAFENNNPELTFKCENPSAARTYAKTIHVPPINTTDKLVVRYYDVRFWDADGTLLDTQRVKGGESAVPPEVTPPEGYLFTGWSQPGPLGVSKDLDLTAQYEKEDPDAHKLTVTFYDYDGSVIDVQKVKPGEDAVAPPNPVREGYGFMGWLPAITNVTKDVDTTAQYDPSRFMVTFLDDDGETVLNTQYVLWGEKPVLPKDPVKDGYTFIGWNPSAENAVITRDEVFYAKYETDKGAAVNNQFTVTFYDDDGVTVLYTQKVLGGEDAVLPKDPEKPGYTFIAWLPSPTNIRADLDTYAKYERDEEDVIGKSFTVNFYDYDGETLLDTQKVKEGGDAVLPKDPERPGYRFTGWLPSPTKVDHDMNTYAQYDRDEEDIIGKKYTVNFYDSDGTTLLHTTEVREGENAVLPESPVKEGYTFAGWVPSPVNVTKDMDVFARYEKKEDSGGKDDEHQDGNGGQNEENKNDDNKNEEGGGGSSTVTTTFYTLTVRNGSGSGSYAAGSQPIIVAADPVAGMEFDNWTIDPADTKIASKVLTATVVTMPERDVTVTANYKKSSGTGSANTSTTGSGNSSSGTGSTYRPNNTGVNGTTGSGGSGSGSGSGGTTVVIDKNGLSNTGVVSAAVNGSSDNFVIKITESANAQELAIRALTAEYGDISNLKYFPMDISLYDSTGKNKITDTTGLSITITIPLPDSLITYAGNNKVASVTDGTLEKLKAKFTTISGVSCVTFTAEHFSPYVIYVDTNNLSAGTISDSTPKTGDGIHPKWFLSIALACISLVLFLKKDRRQPIPVRAKM